MPDYGFYYLNAKSRLEIEKEEQLKKHRESCAKARAKRKKKNR